MKIYRNIISNWIIFYVFFNIFISQESLLLFIKEENFNFALIIFIYYIIITIIIAIILYLLHINKYLFLIAISLFFTLSLYSLKLNFFNTILFLNGNLYGFLVILSSIFIFIILLYLFEKNIFFSKKSIFLLLIISLSFYPANYIQTKINISNEIIDNNQFEKFENLKFIQKPNVYLLLYESLIKPEIIKKNLGLKKVFYETNFERNFINYDNTLTFFYPTINAINSIMRLDQEKFKIDKWYFSGKKESLLSFIFKNNNYIIKNASTTNNFGEKGDFIDYFIKPKIPSMQTSLLCIDQGKVIKVRLRSFFACDVLDKLEKLNIHILPKKYFFTTQYTPESWHKELLENIKRSSESEYPSLNIFYSYNPIGHTPKIYNHDNKKNRDDFKKYFIKNDKLLSKNLKEITNFIQSQDEEAIVIVAGDHGIFLSRGIEFEEDKNFFVEDRHGILISQMITKNKCKNYPEELEVKYLTVSRLMVKIIECLSGYSTSEQKLFNFDEKKMISEYFVN